MPQPPAIHLDTRSPVPAYRQIADQIRTFVVEGSLAPGEPLPPVRRLALELGIHFNTVAEAYRMLANEGLLVITHGHGAQVADRAVPPTASPQAVADFRRSLRAMIAAVRAAGLTPRQIVGELKTVVRTLEV